MGSGVGCIVGGIAATTVAFTAASTVWSKSGKGAKGAVGDAAVVGSSGVDAFPHANMANIINIGSTILSFASKFMFEASDIGEKG